MLLALESHRFEESIAVIGGLRVDDVPMEVCFVGIDEECSVEAVVTF